MKRCIICGNLGDDNSTVCEVCGNPYMDLDDDAPDRMEAGVDPVMEPEIEEPEQEPGIPEDWEPEQEAAAAEEVEAQEETPVTEETEEAPKEPAAEPVAPPQQPVHRQAAVPQRPVQQPMPPKAAPERTATENPGQMADVPKQAADAPRQATQAARPRTAGGNVHRMSSPQIYGQTAGSGAPGQTQPDGMVRRTMNGNGRPANHQPTAGVRRPANAAGRPMQNRPMNGQGQPMQSRLVNGQGQPMQSRPMNGQGQPIQNRPMNAPQHGVPSMGFRNTKIREMSKKSFRSPLFVLIALLQTVYLAGSIAAIFMKQLNFSQVMRLITGISMPSQLTGYMDQLLKLMAKLDTGAIAANLVIRIPDILMCIGLWMIVFAARSKKEEMPGGGFTFLKVVVIIGLIKSCVLMLAGLVISVALVVSAWASGVQTMIVAAVVTLVIMIVLTMFVVMYYFSYLAMLRTFRTNTQKGESYGAASGYVAVIYILMGLFGIIGLLSGIVNGEISGIVGSAGKIGWMLLMAFWIFRYRSTLSEIED